MPIPSAPSAPSAQTPNTQSSLLAPKNDVSNDIEKMRKDMEAEKLKQRQEESKKLNELLNKVSDDLEIEKQETMVDLKQSKEMDDVMNKLHNSFDKLMKI